MGRCLARLVNHTLGGLGWVVVSLGWSINPKKGGMCPPGG